MTGPASNRGRLFSDFDAYKSQEWSRRRKLRLEQVRKQSNEIAKELRQKAAHEEKIKTEKLQRIKEAQLKCWRVEKLEELENKLMCALEEFGRGHKLAESEPDPDEILQIRNKINELKAQERGEIAYQEELRNKKLAKERELSPIRRRQLTRKLEDLRSALIRSVTIQKQLIEARDSNDIISENHEGFKKRDSAPGKSRTGDTTNDNQTRETTRKKVKKIKKKKSVQNHDAGIPKSQNDALKCHPKRNLETVWVNLNEIQSSSGIDSGSKYGSSQSVLGNKTHKKKTEKTIEFYDYPSRYYCKSFREFPNLVERIAPESGPNANELSKIEEESEIAENQKKTNADAISKERGMEALKKEKINRDYQNMLLQLEELSKKEKIIKAQQRITPSVVHMTDERLMEKNKIKQKMMDSKFESIYYEALSEIPPAESRADFQNLYDHSAGGDHAEPSERLSTKLSFSPSNPKTNSPVTPSASPVKTLYLEEIRNSPKRTKSKTKKKLLSDIDKALKEGRKLRETISQNWERFEVRSSGEGSDFKTDEYVSPLESDDKRTVSGKGEDMEKVVRSHDKESQTEDLGSREVGVQKEEFGDFKDVGKTGDESLPVSTSTSYKSPPSEIRSCRLRQFLECLESVSENEDIIESNPQLRRKIKKFIYGLSRKINSLRSEDREKFFKSSALEYYILKLLNMSREAVANLSVSSDNTTTPNLTDLDLNNCKSPDEQSQTSEYIVKVTPEKEKLVRDSILKRATSLEKEIINWKEVLEENLNSTEPKLTSHDEPDGGTNTVQGKLLDTVLESDSLKNSDVACLLNSGSRTSQYEKISKKCSDRISKLSVMLQKVRKDKEKLLYSTSGTSSFSTNKEEKNEDVVPVVQNSYPDSFSKHFFLLEDFIDRYNLSRQRENSVSDSDNESVASSDSFPDIMEELLKKNIISSPFKWNIGDQSFEISFSKEKSPQPPSIETVIEKFRREMSKIKPQSFTSDISEPFSPMASKLSNSIEPKHLSFLHCSDNSSERNRNSPGSSQFDIEELPSRNLFQNLEESSVDSINRALTSLGLNWAKSVLRKSEETKAMSSSSESDGVDSDGNDGNYYYQMKCND